jgi:uncharacterized ion transporter superfamily protein YfcC
MSGFLTIVVFMALVVGVAAGILVVMDRMTLRRGLSENERQNIVANRTH